MFHTVVHIIPESCDILLVHNVATAGTSADEGVGICHAICEHLLTLKVGYTAFLYTTWVCMNASACV